MGRQRSLVRLSRLRSGLFALATMSLLATACSFADGATPTTTPAALGTTTTPTTLAPEPPVTTIPTVDTRLPDVSARPLSTADLIAMLHEDATDATVVSNEGLVTASLLDPEDEASDHAAFSRIVGVAGAWPDGTGTVRIDLLADSQLASGFLTDRVGDFAKGLEGATELVDVSGFPVAGVGDEAQGLIMQGSETTETAIFFRLGRLAATVTVAGDGDGRVAAQYLAEDVHHRIESHLTGAPLPTATGAPPSFTFVFEQVAVVDGVQHTWRADGRVVDGDLDCTVRVGTQTRTIRIVDGVMWTGSGDALDRAGGAALGDRALLAFCPAWQLDARVSGLHLVVGSDPASHTIDGTSAFGHRGDAAELALVLGTSEDNVSVEVFNVWIAEDTPWLVELDLTATGTGAALGSLLGMDVAADAVVELSLRHQVLALGATAPIFPPA